MNLRKHLRFSYWMMAILPMFLYASMQMRQQNDREAAYQIIASRFEQLSALQYDNLLDDYEEETLLHENGQLYRISIDIDDGDDLSTIESGDDELASNFKRIHIAVSWVQSGGSTRAVSLGKLRLRD